MPTWIRAMLARPPTPTGALTRWTIGNGVLYLALGATFLFVPTLPELWGAPPIAGDTAGFGRLLGFAVAVIGWFYVMGGRTHAESFGLATVFDRVFFVPICLGGLTLAGEVHVAVTGPFLVLDPLLGLGAYMMWRRDRARRLDA